MQFKKHIKRTQDRPGGIVDIEVVMVLAVCTKSLLKCFMGNSKCLQKPIAYSNVSLIDPVTKAPCRVSWRYLADGAKVSDVEVP